MLALFPFLVTNWNTWALATYSLGVAADLCFFTKVCPAPPTSWAASWRCPGTSWTRVSCSCWPSPDPGLHARETHCWGGELSTFHILLPILNFTFSFINISSLLSFLVLPRLFVGFSLTSTHQHHHRGLPQHSTNTTGVP